MQNFLFLALAGMYFFCVFRMFARFSIVFPCMDFCVFPLERLIYTQSCLVIAHCLTLQCTKTKVYCINLNTYNFQFVDEIILYFLAGKRFHPQLLNELASYFSSKTTKPLNDQLPQNRLRARLSHTKPLGSEITDGH